MAASGTRIVSEETEGSFRHLSLEAVSQMFSGETFIGPKEVLCRLT